MRREREKNFKYSLKSFRRRENHQKNGGVNNTWKMTKGGLISGWIGRQKLKEREERERNFQFHQFHKSHQMSCVPPIQF